MSLKSLLRNKKHFAVIIRSKNTVVNALVSSKPRSFPLMLNPRNSYHRTTNQPGFVFFLWLVPLSIIHFARSESNKISYAHCEPTQNGGKIYRNFIADAADIASPAVVNIITAVDWRGASSGSGFILSRDGFVVTNAHVVARSADGKVLVTMWDGRKLAGFVHSMDQASDIALVKLLNVVDDLPVALLGVSGKLRVGEFVVALGSPLQLQNSVTFGIVSATARHASELGLSKNRSDYIQTDAAINAGNSGGPLVNLDGEVIGINTMKVDGTSGISFAIPIDTAAQIIKQLMTNKRVIRPYIGLKMANFTSDTSSFEKRKGALLSTDTPKVLVVEVERDSPASRAGIQRLAEMLL